MLEILNNSAAKSGLIAFKAPFVFRRDFKTNFSTKWMHKDIGLALESAQELGVPMPMTSLTEQMLSGSNRRGLRGRRSVLDYPGFGRMGWRRGQGKVKNTKNCCIPQEAYTIIGIKPGRKLPPKRD